MAQFQYRWIDLSKDFYAYGKICDWGQDGWELVCIYNDIAYFKRPYCGAETSLDNIDNEITELKDKVEELTKQLKYRDAILIGLVEALAEKFCPDSKFLASFKDEMELDKILNNTSASLKYLEIAKIEDTTVRVQNFSNFTKERKCKNEKTNQFGN